ncbi:hypothetical protein [Paraburkholderia tropica]|uniref:hypothetical protein n=1 Tax=Paraburkholderia tropica TaxID=92647 RepID=UPI002AB6BE43|nr:hypothetical protein [Paraburkholderia tropica]
MTAGLIGARTIAVQTFIDEQRFSFFHCVLFLPCFLIVGLDGFDTGAMAFIAPTLEDD